MGQDDVHWFLYSDRPVTFKLDKPNQIKVRAFSSHNFFLSPIRSQLVFSHWVKMDSIDVFWSPRHHLPLFMDANVKAVVTIHDMVWKTFPETMRAMNRLLERLLMPPSLKRASRIIAVSQATSKEIGDGYPEQSEKVVVVHEAADKYVNVLPVEYSYSYFLFVGTMEPRKNLVNILAAFQKAAFKIPQHFVFIGGVGWGKDIALEVRKLDPAVQARCHFIGAVSDEMLQSHYVGATGHVLASLSEGFGLPALEAMQHGVPVIVSHGSAFPEVVGDAGIYVDPLNVDEISDAIVRLASDAAFRGRLGVNALRQSDKFSWALAARQTRQVLLESLV
ncbi:MAG: glycosyltransferase involved in cell wall biosynthesis [Candidatus Azotimanducaceae bacterium]|jgi:glycosyltransferase involved in cell wall biosynthesis